MSQSVCSFVCVLYACLLLSCMHASVLNYFFGNTVDIGKSCTNCFLFCSSSCKFKTGIFRHFMLLFFKNRSSVTGCCKLQSDSVLTLKHLRVLPDQSSIQEELCTVAEKAEHEAPVWARAHPLPGVQLAVPAAWPPCGLHPCWRWSVLALVGVGFFQRLSACRIPCSHLLI